MSRNACTLDLADRSRRLVAAVSTDCKALCDGVAGGRWPRLGSACQTLRSASAPIATNGSPHRRPINTSARLPRASWWRFRAEGCLAPGWYGSRTRDSQIHGLVLCL